MINRRDFLKKTAAGVAVVSLPDSNAYVFGKSNRSEKVRFGIIGCGGRGSYLMKMILKMPGTEVTAICDINKKNLQRGIKIVEETRGNTPARYSKDEYDYRNMLKRNDFDVVLIATSIKWHGVMSIDSLNAGKHVGCEVPACRNLSECEALVKAKEKSGCHYMMMENYIYWQDNLAIFNMVRGGLFGEVYYGECGYIHEYKAGHYNSDGSLNWRGELATTDYGNNYPTHSGGPIFKWFGINDGDRLERLSCYETTPNRTAKEFYADRFGAEKAAKLTWRQSEMTTCLIKTAKGKVIKIDQDVQSNRPHSFYYLMQGTRGIFDNRFGISLAGEVQKNGHLRFRWEKANKYIDEYESRLWKKYGDQARSTGHGGADFFTVRDLVEMVCQDREPWIDVYDAASWSAIYECSRRSLDNKNAAIEIPDFTRGRWKKTDWRKDNMSHL